MTRKAPRPVKTETETYSRRQMVRAKSTGGYFLFFRNHGRLMSKVEALFLQDLTNREDMRRTESNELRRLGKTKQAKRKFEEETAWFQCTTSYLTNPRYLVWSENEQKRHFKSLIKKGYVKVKRKGTLGRRWVWVNVWKIESDLDKLLYPNQLGEKPPD